MSYADKRRALGPLGRAVVDTVLARWNKDGRSAANEELNGFTGLTVGERCALADIVRGLYCDAHIPSLAPHEGSWVVYAGDGAPIEFRRDQRLLVEQQVVLGYRCVTITTHLASLTKR